MSHRAALYRVQVRAKRDQGWRLLGDYDEAGTWLGSHLMPALAGIGTALDGTGVVRFEGALPNLGVDEIGISVISGKSGITSVLERGADPPFQRTPEHVEGMRSAALFRLPRGGVHGVLAVHVPHGRSAKRVLERNMKGAMSGRGFVLEVSPIVPPSALEEAVQRDALERVTLIKRDPSKAEKFRDAARWGDDKVRQVELSMPSKRNRRLRSDPLDAFLRDPSDENRKAIIEFSGMVFDEVALTVMMPDGAYRTFFLEPREGGHPMTVGLDVEEDDRLGATSHSLSNELRRVVSDLGLAP